MENDNLKTESNNANVLLCAVFKAISITPTEDEMQFVETIINGGKTDNTERARTICGYFDKQGNEKAIYDLLEARWL
jgi:hypothetical protein